MTTNAYILVWDETGIESIVPITRYEKWDQHQLVEILASRQNRSEPNPIGIMINTMMLRARFNSQRHYEIYAIDCDDTFTKEVWSTMWEKEPQATAELVRERGLKILSQRGDPGRIVIT